MGNVSYLTIQLLHNVSGECFLFNDSIIAQPKLGNVSYLTIQLLHNLSGECFLFNDSIIAQRKWGMFLI